METLKTRPGFDLARALRYLRETEEALAQATNGVTADQCCRKPGPDAWSMAEVVEHLAIVEGLFLNGAAMRLPEAPPPDETVDAEELDARILAMSHDRSNRISAPERTRPTSSAAFAQSLETFRARRAQTIAFFRSVPDLCAHAVPHPLFGQLDGYQWALLVASHTERHVNQILEVKAGWQ